MKNDEQFNAVIEPRIEWLKKEKKYIEAFFFLCAVLEQELITLIELYENYYSRLASNYNKKLNLADYRKERFKKMTLGQVRNYLVIFISKGNLIKELDYFIELRNECVHKILDKDISILDIKVLKNLNRFYRLLTWLYIRQTKILKSEVRSFKRKIKKKNDTKS